MSDVTITNAYYFGSINPPADASTRKAMLLLIGSVVSNCVLESSSQTPALGGGVYTLGYLTLFDSAITGNHVLTVGGAAAFGGGVFVGWRLHRSVQHHQRQFRRWVWKSISRWRRDLCIRERRHRRSTVSGNRAGYIAGIDMHPHTCGSTGKIVNSTISSNTAVISGGGIYSKIPLTLANSTVAFNTSESGSHYAAGVYVYDASLTLQSSIIASNAAPDGQSDLGGTRGDRRHRRSQSRHVNFSGYLDAGRGRYFYRVPQTRSPRRQRRPHANAQAPPFEPGDRSGRRRRALVRSTRRAADVPGQRPSRHRRRRVAANRRRRSSAHGRLRSALRPLADLQTRADPHDRAATSREHAASAMRRADRPPVSSGRAIRSTTVDLFSHRLSFVVPGRAEHRSPMALDGPHPL